MRALNINNIIFDANLATIIIFAIAFIVNLFDIIINTNKIFTLLLAHNFDLSPFKTVS